MLLLLLAFFGWSVVFINNTVFPQAEQSLYGVARTEQITIPGLRPGEAVTYDMSHYSPSLWLYQWQLSDARLVPVNTLYPNGNNIGTRFLISGKKAPAGYRQALLIWSSPNRNQAVWQLRLGE